MDLETRVRDLLAHKYEEEWFEFKTNWYEPSGIGEYISSMSNAAALAGEKNAYLIWGVDNDTHQITGTDFDYHRDVKNEPLQHYLARQIKPDNGFTFHEITLDGKRLVVLEIPAAKNAPTSFNRNRYLRIGSSKVNLMDYPEREAQLFNVLTHGIPTIENTASEYQDLAFNKLFVYYEAKGITLNKRTFKKNLGFLTEDGRYNVMAQLLSDDSHIPIRFSLFNGTDKTSVMYSVREFGNTCLLYSLDDVLNYGDILNIPQADERNRVVERKEVMLFSKDAYHEAVINAFVHNHWIEGNAPMFTGFQDRIEILSRGVLPPEQTMEGFYAGESVPVNQKLSDMFLQLHISERSGRGMPKIIEYCGTGNLSVNENSICVTIPYERLTYAEQSNVQALVPKVPVDAQVDTQVDTQVDAQVDAQAADELEKYHKVIEFCRTPKSSKEIGDMLEYKNRRSVKKVIDKLIEKGQIMMTVPDKPNSSKQKYITVV